MGFDLLQLLYVLIIGTVIGSFLNVVVDRLPKGESITFGRSYCDSCKRTLLWYDLIPVVSYVLLRGRCRFCRKPIGYYYPLIEITTGFLFALSFLHAQSISELLYLLLIIAVLVVIFFADLKYGIIPFYAVGAGMLIVLFRLIFLSQPDFIASLLSSLGAGAFFLIIFLLTRGRGMGFGDVVYAFFMGLLLSFPGIIIGLYLGFLTGAIVSLILIAGGKKKLRGDTIPFGPFLVFGTVIALLYGQEILKIVQPYFPL